MKLLGIILIEFGKKEDEIFKNRHKVSQQRQINYQPPKIQAKPLPNLDEYVNFMNYKIIFKNFFESKLSFVLFSYRIKSLREKPMPMRFGPPCNFRRPDSSLKKSFETKIQITNSSATTPSNSQLNNETKQETSDSSISNQQEDNDPNDTVRLWEEGWHERYYKSKFHVDQDHVDECRIQVVEHYVRGLCWVLEYYYHGVPSWDWYLFM
jgi:5'-3' exoribonuclease 2